MYYIISAGTTDNTKPELIITQYFTMNDFVYIISGVCILPGRSLVLEVPLKISIKI